MSVFINKQSIRTDVGVPSNSHLSHAGCHRLCHVLRCLLHRGDVRETPRESSSDDNKSVACQASMSATRQFTVILLLKAVIMSFLRRKKNRHPTHTSGSLQGGWGPDHYRCIMRVLSTCLLRDNSFIAKNGSIHLCIPTAYSIMYFPVYTGVFSPA